jgi:hypothetical protein
VNGRRLARALAACTVGATVLWIPACGGPARSAADSPATDVPAAMLVLAILGINVFGDGLRDALDPRARVRIDR